MSAVLLDGKALAQTMQAEIAADAAAFTRDHGVRPGLAAVLVGDSPQSQSYVRSKQRACEKANIASWLHHLPQNTPQADLLALVARLNADTAVHGILVQLPLPPHNDEAAVVDAVSPLKDVDGFGPESLGLLAAGRPRFLACTPFGVQQLLVRNGVALAGAHVVVVGRSNIVGRPLSLILSQKGVDATVTLCHSRSRDVAAPDALRRYRRGRHWKAPLPPRRHGSPRRRGRGRGHEPDAGRQVGRRRRLRGAASGRRRRSRLSLAASGQ